MTTEDKAKAYAEKAYYPAPEYGWYESDHEAMTDVLEQTYLAGATEALASQWVSVEERLPKPHEEVLTYTVGAIDTNAVAYHDGEDWYTTNGEHIRPHFWLPIPPLKGGDV